MNGSYGEELLRAALAGTAPAETPVTHSEVIPSASAVHAQWPQWADPAIVAAYAELGLHRPWRHQIEAADHAFAGRHVVISTGTASGKSLAYQLPVLQTLLHDHATTALYLAPTKALGVDQLRSLTRILATNPEFSRLAPSTYDGDTDPQMRQWARANSRILFTNPDMLHIGILSGHHRWQQFLRQLRFIVVDECHHYRGVFGAHTALVLRRLIRVARAAGADPVVVAASATTAEPARTLSRLIGEPALAVTHDASPTGERTVALWEPGFLPEVTGENGAPVRRSAGAEAGRLLADFVVEGARTLCFVRSRRGAEITARTAAGLLAASAPDLAGRVAAYRAGYLADDRRRLERAIADGELLGVATTNALELGVDISGLDAVIIAGYPGTVASFWQQAGRAGRRGAASAVVLIARDEPLDTYLVHHPEALLRKPVEATVFDPTNPYVLKPHLLCAAAELPLKPAEVERLGVGEAVAELTEEGLLRRRKAGWYLAAGVEPHADIDIRGGIGGQILIVDTSTSQLLGTVDTVRALSTVHPGAVHIHQGASYVVDELGLDDGLALAHPEEPDWTTSPRETTEVEVVDTLRRISHGALQVALVDVTVTSQVVGYLRKLHSGEILDAKELDLPPQTLPTRAVQYTLTPEALAGVRVTDANLPGALHAAEHAMIGLLPLVATCDRWDIGGLSTNLHADTGLPTVYVYDGYPGGAGFADRGYEAFAEWVAATHEAVSACGCESGCPSCIQSPKCGNGNEPLDKAGAVAVLELIQSLLRGS
ncbi:putative ATP-dependent helicase [Gordonia araii NBRC 100433]|uniref:Putative ATP-dependent helicase n=1 Tax=Gordonia araii NBRC 100433 TaxID=1073574 RepID=G7H0T7_9ACTN|nr:DEAD/DEAH box helicase [Gordonia araii]NNG99200.1 DEAD/DEAH box helicase [Gordonia araii NBRC 100433]GAB09462.1 putative ATP-dependent helicase [Gordonia araii NBRC 100433]